MNLNSTPPVDSMDKNTFVGVSIETPTPALVVDAAITRRNLQHMADYVRRHGLGLRPHTKTHKSKMIARLQMEAGAIGLTVAKAGEAEVMREADDDILVAYPAVDPTRCRRLAALSLTSCLRVAVDTAAAVEALGAAATAVQSTIGILVELDVGMERTGVATAADTLTLARLVTRTAGLRLDGILCYPGHIWAQSELQAAPLAEVSARLDEAISLWSRDGLEARIVSGGSTPTACQSHLVRSYTEIRPGTYIYNDMNTVRGGYCSIDDCAARVVCTVVSDAVKNQIVIDGGTKTFTNDLCLPARESGHGLIVEYPDAKIVRFSEEHGRVDVSRCERRPRVGDRVTVIPNHICPCVNLHDRFWWVEANGVARECAVDARGMLS